MARLFSYVLISLATLLLFPCTSYAQQVGSIRGTVRDAEFDAVTLGKVQVQIAETGEKTTTADDGSFSFAQVPPGKYTLIFTRNDYFRQVKNDVIVEPAQVADASASLSSDITEIESVTVTDLKLGAGTEEGLLKLRMEKPGLVDSVSADMMKLAGAGNVSDGLRLVSGATVQDGKYAVVRGLPDRYVVSQLNGVRLPTADADKRAVQLDQFPASAVESIQVSKSFTPDMQGDASGGAVNIVLKGVPEKPFFSFKTGTGFNTRDPGNGKFLTYKGGGVGALGRDDGGRDIQMEFFDAIYSDGVYNGAAGITPGDGSFPYNWSMSGGYSFKLNDEWRLGAMGNLYYEQKNTFQYGIEDKAWVLAPGEPITPQYRQGSPSQGEFKTSMYDIARNGEEVKLGGLGVLGLESENNKFKFVYLETINTQDIVTLAQDTRGKSYFFPGYNSNDPASNGFDQPNAAPWLRSETLAYTERSTQTFQLSGFHKVAEIEENGDLFSIKPPEIDWSVSKSVAELIEPDKRRFTSAWTPGVGAIPSMHTSAKDAANFTLGNLQRTWKSIQEDSTQYSINLKLPFKQWSDSDGFFKLGIFNDHVIRKYDQESFSNFSDPIGAYIGDWEDYWSNQFSQTYHKVTPASIDVDYEGKQDISAWYLMTEFPLTDWLSIVGGVRFEHTALSIVNTPEADVTWVPPGSTTPVTLNPGDSDVSFEQSDILPSIGLIIKPTKTVTLRASYSQTIARQTFKELTPIQQQEYAGADIFIGNPFLKMSALSNYDLRVDYTPYEGTLLSASYFYKQITNPIEYVQRNAGFVYTTAENYPDGTLDGIELEIRHNLGGLDDMFKGLTLGANATFIRSKVNLPDDEISSFNDPFIAAPMTSRDMTNAPKFLYNLFATWDFEKSGTQLGLFYTVRGDTLVAGAGTGSGLLVPDIYELEYGTLNASITQNLGGGWKIGIQAKNILDPSIKSVYRSHITDEEFTKSEYRKGTEIWFNISAEF